jgi:hypothetical protein
MMSKSIYFCYRPVILSHRFTLSILFYLLSAFIILTFVSCTDPNLAGTSSGTEAKIAQGCIIKENGTVAAQARVRILSVNYNPLIDTLSDSAIATTNEKGEFELFTTDTGLYNIQANFIDGTCSMVHEVHILYKITIVPVSTLHAPGKIKVKLPADFDTSNGYVYLPGTDLFVRIKGKCDSVTIDSVPESDLISINYSRVNSSSPQTLQRNINVHAGNTTFVALYDWKYSADINFNTTGSGAGITANVYNFPVLVRLDRQSFNFDQAQSAGEDIRFTKKNGAALSYEIEQWDANNGKAAIWVKMDTICGNDSSQSISMHWGASTPSTPSTSSGTLGTSGTSGTVTISESNGAKVFDTANGFQGVWHLYNSGNRLPDATSNNFDGTIKDSMVRETGVAGYGQTFDHSGEFIDMGNVCNPGASDFTFSAWVKKSVLGKRQTIVSKSAGGSASSSYGWLFELDPEGVPILFMSSASGTWGSPGTFVLASDIWITDTSWHHIALVIDRHKENSSRIYVDGKDGSSLPANGTSTAGEITNSVPLRFGSDGNGNNSWNGSLDEISLSRTTRAGDYIKLMFENQKITSKLITIGKTHN